MVIEKDLPYEEMTIEANASADNDLNTADRGVPIFHSPAQSEFSISDPDLWRKHDEFDFLNDEVDGGWSTQIPSPENRRQRLLRAIHSHNTQEVSDILNSAQDAAELLHEVEYPQDPFSWPITPLSLALLEGDESLVRILLQHGKAGTCGLAIKHEVEQLLPTVQNHMFEQETDNGLSVESSHIDREIGREYEVALLELHNCVISFLWSDPASAEITSLRQHFIARHIPPHACLRYRKRWLRSNDTVDPTSLALRSLLFSSGDVEALFVLLRNASLDLRHAQFCDVGRTLWFWAAQKNYVSILRVFLEDGFSINFRATTTRFASASVSQTSEFWRGGYFEASPTNTTALWNSAYTGANRSVNFLLERGALLHAELLEVEREFVDELSKLAYVHLESQTDEYLRTKTKIPQQSPRRVEIPTSDESNAMASLLSDSKLLALAIFGGSSDDERLNELQAMSIGLSYTRLRRHTIGDELLQKKIEQYAITLAPLLQAGCDPNTVPSTKSVLKHYTSPELAFDTFSSPTIIWHFVKAEHKAAIETLIQHGADIQGNFDDGRTLLHYAVGSDSAQMMQLALDQGVAINQKDSAGLSAMHYAVLQQKHVSLLFLLEQGVSPEDPTQPSISPLLMAANLSDLKSTKMLLAYHADPCYSFGDRNNHLTEEDIKSRSWAAIFRAGTPLLAALKSRKCDIDLVECLLKGGADPQQPGLIAIRRARRSVLYSSNAVPDSYEVQSSEKEEILNDSLNEIDYDPAWTGDQRAALWRQSWGWDVHVYDPIQYTTQFFTNTTTENSDKQIWLSLLKMLLTHVKQSNKPLSRTCIDNCMRILCTIDLDYNWSETGFDRRNRHWFAPLDAIDLLLGYGANPMVRGSQGLSLLHTICSSACSNKNDESQVNGMIQRLVEIGAYVNAADSQGRAPLHYAAVLCPSAIVTLLECGAAHHAADLKGRTPILYACGGKLLSSYSFRPKSLRILLDHHDGRFVWWTEVLLAACHRAGQEPRSRSRRSDVDVEQLIKDIVAMDKGRHLHILSETDGDGNTALHLAADREFVEPLKGLCTASSLPWQALAMQNSRGETPLIKACQFGGVERVDVMLHAIKTSSSSKWVMHPNHREMFESKPWDDRQRLYTELIDGESIRRLATKGSDAETLTEQSDPTPIEGLAQCLNMQDNCGWTALHYAARRGDHEVVQLLVNEELLDPGPSAGCCIPSPLDLAYKSENGRCVRLIGDAIAQRRNLSNQKKRSELQTRTKLSNTGSEYDDHRQTTLSRMLSLMGRVDIRIAVGLCSFIWVLWRLRFVDNRKQEVSA